MPTMLESLEDYFKNTPKEKILSDWKKTEKYNDVGPLAKDYIDEVKKLNTMWNRCNVVMLSTNEKAKSQLILENKILKLHPSKIDIGNKNYQHLYITSDEEIKEGDWTTGATGSVIQCMHPEMIIHRDI